MTSWHPTSKMFLIGATEVHACVQEGFASFWVDPGCLPLAPSELVPCNIQHISAQHTLVVTQFPGITPFSQQPSHPRLPPLNDLRYHPQATTIIAECELLRWRIAKGLYSCSSCIEDVLLLFARAEHHPALLLNVSACKFCWVELHNDQYLCQLCIILHPLHAEYGAGSNWQPLVACVIVGSTFSPNPPLLAIQTNCSSTSIAVHKCPAWINALISFLISRLSFGHALGLWHFLRRQVTEVKMHLQNLFQHIAVTISSSTSESISMKDTL